MKLPLLALVLAVGSVPPARSAPPPAAADSPEKALEPFETVRSATRFSIGGVGFAGAIAPAETALRRLLKEAEALKKCQSLMKEGTPAGKLYGLFGARQLDREVYKTALPLFLKDRTKVSHANGCHISESTVAEIAKLIRDGKMK